jgi:hypothetical protein
MKAAVTDGRGYAFLLSVKQATRLPWADEPLGAGA